MFVIGGSFNKICELFDNSSKKSIAIKEMDVFDFNSLLVVSIGNKIFAFPKIYNSTTKSVQVYDVLKNQ